MLRFLLLLAPFLLILTAPLQAAEINDTGAAHLKTLFTKLIEDQKASLTRTGGSLETEGEITVEQGKDYYAVTLPSMSVHNADGMEATIGLLAVNVTPTEKKEEWKMSVAIPTPILYADKENTKTTRLDIGGQTMSGVWNENLENFSKLAASYTNLKLSHYARQETLIIDQLDVTVDLTEVKKDHWTGPTKFGIAGLSFGKPESARSFYAEDIRLGVTLDEFSPKAQKRALQHIAELNDETVEKKEENPDTSSLLLDLFRTSGHSFDLQAALKNIEINTPATDNLSKNRFSLDSGSFSFNVNGMRTGLLNKKINLSYSNLNAPNSDSVYQNLVPKNFKTNIIFSNFPIVDIIESAHRLFPTGEKKKMSRQIAALQTMITLPQILAKAGTTMELKDSTYSNDLYNTNLDGKLTANSNSIIGTTGDLTLKMQGLDTVITKLNEQLATATPGEKKKIERGVKWLGILKKISKKEEKNYICNIKLNEKAKVTINGSNIESLEKEEPSQEVTE